MNAKTLAAKIRAAAETVSPAYHYDSIDAAIANAFNTLADQIEKEGDE